MFVKFSLNCRDFLDEFVSAKRAERRKFPPLKVPSVVLIRAPLALGPGFSARLHSDYAPNDHYHGIRFDIVLAEDLPKKTFCVVNEDTSEPSVLFQLHELECPVPVSSVQFQPILQLIRKTLPESDLPTLNAFWAEDNSKPKSLPLLETHKEKELFGDHPNLHFLELPIVAKLGSIRRSSSVVAVTHRGLPALQLRGLAKNSDLALILQETPSDTRTYIQDDLLSSRPVVFPLSHILESIECPLTDFQFVRRGRVPLERKEMLPSPRAFSEAADLSSVLQCLRETGAVTLRSLNVPDMFDTRPRPRNSIRSAFSRKPVATLELLLPSREPNAQDSVTPLQESYSKPWDLLKFHEDNCAPQLLSLPSMPFDDLFRLTYFRAAPDPDAEFMLRYRVLAQCSASAVHDKFRSEMLRVGVEMNSLPRSLPNVFSCSARAAPTPNPLQKALAASKGSSIIGLENYMKAKGHDPKQGELEKLKRSLLHSRQQDDLSHLALSLFVAERAGGRACVFLLDPLHSTETAFCVLLMRLLLETSSCKAVVASCNGRSRNQHRASLFELLEHRGIDQSKITSSPSELARTARIAFMTIEEARNIPLEAQLDFILWDVCAVVEDERSPDWNETALVNIRRHYPNAQVLILANRIPPRAHLLSLLRNVNVQELALGPSVFNAAQVMEIHSVPRSDQIAAIDDLILSLSVRSELEGLRRQLNEFGIRAATSSYQKLDNELHNTLVGVGKELHRALDEVEAGLIPSHPKFPFLLSRLLTLAVPGVKTIVVVEDESHLIELWTQLRTSFPAKVGAARTTVDLQSHLGSQSQVLVIVAREDSLPREGFFPASANHVIFYCAPKTIPYRSPWASDLSFELLDTEWSGNRHFASLLVAKASLDITRERFGESILLGEVDLNQLLQSLLETSTPVSGGSHVSLFADIVSARMSPRALIASSQVFELRGFVESLAHYGISLIERVNPWNIDLLINSSTCLILFNSGASNVQEKIERLRETLLSIAPHYALIWIQIVQPLNAHFSRASSVLLRHFWSVLALFPNKVRLVVQHETILPESILAVILESDKGEEPVALAEREIAAERFLACLPPLDALKAQRILETMSIRELVLMTLAERAERLPWLSEESQIILDKLLNAPLHSNHQDEVVLPYPEPAVSGLEDFFPASAPLRSSPIVNATRMRPAYPHFALPNDLPSAVARPGTKEEAKQILLSAQLARRPPTAAQRIRGSLSQNKRH